MPYVQGKSGALFSKCRTYRYLLWRVWNPSKPLVLWVGLNPSTADEHKNDQTVKRFIHFSKAWGYGGFVVANLYAYRSTKPSRLFLVADPIGPDNDRIIDRVQREVSLTVVGWGAFSIAQSREQKVLARLGADLWCLGKTVNGNPKHPLRLNGATMPERFTPQGVHQCR